MWNVGLFNLKRRLFTVNADLTLSRSCHSRCLTEYEGKNPLDFEKHNHEGKLFQKKNRFSIWGNGNTCNSWLLSDLKLYLVL